MAVQLIYDHDRYEEESRWANVEPIIAWWGSWLSVGYDLVRHISMTILLPEEGQLWPTTAYTCIYDDKIRCLWLAGAKDLYTEIDMHPILPAIGCSIWTKKGEDRRQSGRGYKDQRTKKLREELYVCLLLSRSRWLLPVIRRSTCTQRLYQVWLRCRAFYSTTALAHWYRL